MSSAIPPEPKPGERWMAQDGATGTWTVWRAGETNESGFRFDSVVAIGLAFADARLLVYGAEAVAVLRQFVTAEDHAEECFCRHECDCNVAHGQRVLRNLEGK